jgi:hypothetical protein
MFEPGTDTLTSRRHNQESGAERAFEEMSYTIKCADGPHAERNLIRWKPEVKV